MRRAVLLALSLTALALTVASPASALEQTLTTDGGLLGFSAAVDGDTLVLGEPSDGNGQGAVYVFRRSGDHWAETAKLTASDGTSGDVLGSSVAIDGDTILAGASGDTVGDNADQGSVYTFARTGAAARTETAKLVASDGAKEDRLGGAVAIDGDTIVAGAPGKQGSVYTFTRKGAATRSETAKLTVSNGAATDGLGTAVGIDGDTIVAGAPSRAVGDIAGRGAVYTFARTGATTRSQTATLIATNGGANNLLGQSVAIDGDTIVAGAPNAGASGRAYTFARTGAPERQQTATLAATDRAADDGLGFSVAIDGATIVTGAPGDTIGENKQQGSVYTFARVGAPARTQTAKLTDAAGGEGAVFGFSVAVDGSTIVAGAPVGRSASVFFAPAPPPPARIANPVLSKLAVSRKGTKIAFTLSTAANVKLSFAKARPGRKVGKSCRAPSHANRGKRHCTRFVRLGSFTAEGRAGSNTIALTGALSLRKRLARGSYRLTATPTDGAGTRGAARSARFKIGGK